MTTTQAEAATSPESPVTVPTLQDHAAKLAPLGWTGREAEWLALVALHSGVFTRSQWRHYFDDPHREMVSCFVRALVEKKLAFEDERPIFPGGARAVLLTGKPIYHALGIPDVRHRRSKAAKTAILTRRLLSPDYIIERPTFGWLPTEADKVRRFEALGLDRRTFPYRLYGPEGTPRTHHHQCRRHAERCASPPSKMRSAKRKHVHGTTPPLRVTKLQAHWRHGISAALLGVLILLPAPPASAQSRDDFAQRAWTAPTAPEPGHWTERERELWDMLVFNALDNPGMLEGRYTVVMPSEQVAAVNICQQGPDVSDTGMMIEPYDAVWWRQMIQHWSGLSWSGRFVVGDCTDAPDEGWLHVRETRPDMGEPRGAYVFTDRDESSGSEVRWLHSVIIISPWEFYGEPRQRPLPQEEFAQILVHELGHVMGFWHVPQGTGWVMRPATEQRFMLVEEEREMAQLAYRMGSGVAWPGVDRAAAQSRDDFSYWDSNGNGDLTCDEAGDRDEGLRLPAYQDNRDGTGIIYEWLERSRSSDTNNNGIACDSNSNPNGYIPNVQVQPPAPERHPDLVVVSPSVSDSGPAAGAPFTLLATVRNDGDGAAAGTTLRYYRSTDATITTSDTAAGTDAVGGLGAGATSSESIDLTAPSTAGTHYYGACVDAVTDESDITNNCSTSVQVMVPAETQACPADAEIWRGLKVCDERPRDGYDRDAFGTGYSSLEDEIIAALPPTMKANGQVYTPYSCLAFDITATGTAATDIEHIVALAETHDSGIADDRRRDIASDLDNLTIADPTVNRLQKSDRDAAEWMPARHGTWFAERVIQVKLEYGLSIDPAEQDALEALLSGGGAQLNCVDAVAPTPTMLTLSAAPAPAEGGNPVTVTVTLDNPAPATGLTVTLTTGGTATLDTDYTLSSTTITLAEGETAGTVTITVTDDAEDDDGETIVIDAESTNPALTAEQLTLTIEDNDVTPVPALPLGGAMLLGLLLTVLGAVRMRMRDRTNMTRRC